jgi:iron(III) transport system substrate-binding protein
MRYWTLALLGACLVLVCCGRGGGPATPEVVLYSSVDDFLLREVVAAFEKETGVRVRLVGDTEATKTTGLVERLLSERSRPRADVWWSSEPFGTIRLSREGLLEVYASTAVPADWPLRGARGDWYGFANRARVIVYNTARVSEDEAPRRLGELVEPRFRGRIGIARPQFGTTRGHMGYVLDACGGEAFAAWVAGLKANQVRIYDGNASVVRGVAQGEVDVGLTDTDDVWSGQRNQWPVAMVYETADAQRGEGLCSPGPMLVPNTVALVKGGPNPEAARRLIDFLLSPQVERMMARSDSRNIPVRAEVAAEFPSLLVPDGRGGDLEAIAERIPEALRLWDEAMGR